MNVCFIHECRILSEGSHITLISDEVARSILHSLAVFTIVILQLAYLPGLLVSLILLSPLPFATLCDSKALITCLNFFYDLTGHCYDEEKQLQISLARPYQSQVHLLH